MIISLPLNYELKIYLSKQEKRVGICSQKYDEPEKHTLIWDFDEASFSTIKKELQLVQKRYHLPTIIIIESSLKKYHAYCFALRDFRETINILSSTKSIDVEYLRLGIVRGYFTLRISKRDNTDFKTKAILPSIYIDEVKPSELTINEYLTSNRGQWNNG